MGKKSEKQEDGVTAQPGGEKIEDTAPAEAKNVAVTDATDGTKREERTTDRPGAPAGGDAVGQWYETRMRESLANSAPVDIGDGAEAASDPDTFGAGNAHGDAQTDIAADATPGDVPAPTPDMTLKNGAPAMMGPYLLAKGALAEFSRDPDVFRVWVDVVRGLAATAPGAPVAVTEGTRVWEALDRLGMVGADGVINDTFVNVTLSSVVDAGHGGYVIEHAVRPLTSPIVGE